MGLYHGPKQWRVVSLEGSAKDLPAWQRYAHAKTLPPLDTEAV
jgi:hypothetical protein